MKILKVTKNQGFTLSLENSISSILGLNVNAVFTFFILDQKYPLLANLIQKSKSSI